MLVKVMKGLFDKNDKNGNQFCTLRIMSKDNKALTCRGKDRISNKIDLDRVKYYDGDTIKSFLNYTSEFINVTVSRLYSKKIT